MDATSNINLKVSFSEKDQAKSLGARWNAELKLWYVPIGVDATPFTKWFSDALPVATATSKPKLATTNQEPSVDEDMDAINARFRDAYELRELDIQ
jgi:Domain of unknown function (DUF5710)